MHGFNLPRSNYAEGGQSKLKGDRKISLIDSVMEDCIEFLIQAADYENFLNNSEVVRGRGLSQFEREEREHREERNYVESAVRAISSGDLLKRWKQLDSEPRFVPGVMPNIKPLEMEGPVFRERYKIRQRKELQQLRKVKEMMMKRRKKT